MSTERKLTGNGEHGNLAWQHMGVDPWLNRMGDDSGDDPLTGYLKALSNSPDAATDFFNEEYLPKGRDHKEAVSNFTYLFEDREWPKETDLKGDDIHPGQNNLTMAIEAVTTGHPAGELPTADTPAHNDQQAKLMASVVASVSDAPDRLTKNGYMSDSIGQMASEYLPDINRASTDVKPDANSEEWQQIEKLFPVAGASAQMDHAHVSRFLLAVGQNPEGYSAVEVGQKALMDYHLNPDLPEDQRYGQSVENTVTEISRRSAEVGGCLAIGRQEAVLGPAKEADEDYDHAVSQWQNCQRCRTRRTLQRCRGQQSGGQRRHLRPALGGQPRAQYRAGAESRHRGGQSAPLPVCGPGGRVGTLRHPGRLQRRFHGRATHGRRPPDGNLLTRKLIRCRTSAPIPPWPASQASLPSA